MFHFVSTFTFLFLLLLVGENSYALAKNSLSNKQFQKKDQQNEVIKEPQEKQKTNRFSNKKYLSSKPQIANIETKEDIPVPKEDPPKNKKIRFSNKKYSKSNTVKSAEIEKNAIAETEKISLPRPEKTPLQKNKFSNRKFRKNKNDRLESNQKGEGYYIGSDGQKMNLFNNRKFSKSNPPIFQIPSKSLAKPKSKIISPWGKTSLMTFYTVSRGLFEEESTSGSDNISFEQNSPLTLGLFANYRPHKKTHAYQGSIYISKLMSKTSSSNQEISPPLEIGGNVYFEKYFDRISFYGGFDYERFSSFNATEITGTGNVSLKSQQAAFYTAGMGFFFRPFLIKASISKTMLGLGDFTGLKQIFYLGYFTKSKWQYHFLAKAHQLESSNNKLNIVRYGVGVGYSFF